MVRRDFVVKMYVLAYLHSGTIRFIKYQRLFQRSCATYYSTQFNPLSILAEFHSLPLRDDCFREGLAHGKKLPITYFCKFRIVLAL